MIYFKSKNCSDSSDDMIADALQDYLSREHLQTDGIVSGERIKTDGMVSGKRMQTDGIVSGEGEPADFRLEIVRDSHGKPYAASRSDISFSVTHTEDWWICAVGKAGNGSLGIDAEKKARCVKKPAALARRFFHAAEAARVAEAADVSHENSRDLFLNIWVRKEAYLKYTGEGLPGLSGACTVTFCNPEDGEFPDGPDEFFKDGIAEDDAVEFVMADLSEELYVVLCRARDSEDKELVLCQMT